jgi:hypothetical protein
MGIDNLVASEVNSDLKLRLMEQRMSLLATEAEKDEYYRQKDEYINRIKIMVYTYFVCLQVALLTVRLVVLKFVKKDMLLYAT